MKQWVCFKVFCQFWHSEHELNVLSSEQIDVGLCATQPHLQHCPGMIYLCSTLPKTLELLKVMAFINQERRMNFDAVSIDIFCLVAHLTFFENLLLCIPQQHQTASHAWSVCTIKVCAIKGAESTNLTDCRWTVGKLLLYSKWSALSHLHFRLHTDS